MANTSKRVFIRGARLSYPALDEPRESMAGSGDKKYQATFLLEPNNPSVDLIKKAMVEVANAAFGDQAGSILKHPDKIPLKRGDDKDTIPEGYVGMLYISARSKDKPELRDANPRILITSQEDIRTKFVPGYVVNGFVDIYAYEVKNGNTIMKKGIACALVSVQFNAYADSFTSRTPTSADDYPDCTAEAEASSGYNPYAQSGAPTAPAAPTVEDDGLPFQYYRPARAGLF